MIDLSLDDGAKGCNSIQSKYNTVQLYSNMIFAQCAMCNAHMTPILSTHTACVMKAIFQNQAV